MNRPTTAEGRLQISNISKNKKELDGILHELQILGLL